jgi:hypothetical protein
VWQTTRRSEPSQMPLDTTNTTITSQEHHLDMGRSPIILYVTSLILDLDVRYCSITGWTLILSPSEKLIVNSSLPSPVIPNHYIEH